MKNAAAEQRVGVLFAATLVLIVVGLGCPHGTAVPAPGGGSSSSDDAGTAAGDAGIAAGPDAGSPADAGETVDCYGVDEGDLPTRVVFRTSTTTFNRQWYAALHEGKIWIKGNTDEGAAPGDWRLLGSGLPAGDLTHFQPPTEVAEISGDGTWLHAISSAGVFYRGTNFATNIEAGFSWSDAWGHPAATGPGITVQWPTTHGWSVSDSQLAGVNNYQDRLGATHDVGMGVAHVYRMGPTGHSLFLNDWWLPADWSRQICLPARGTFFVQNMSASASTIFIIGALGEMYTRLYDFDTSGEDDLIEYTWQSTEASSVRAAPAEDWWRQPAITDGLVTQKITIFQDGQGNAARMLRVEGVRNGRTGYFHKHVLDDAWSFAETGARVCGPFLNAPGRAAPPPIPRADFTLRGTLSVNRVFEDDVTVDMQVDDFNIVCSPASMHLLVNGQLVTVGGQPLAVPFHHVHRLVLETRPTEFWLMGQPARIRAALLVPAGIDQIDDATARTTVQSLFRNRKGANFQGTVSLTDISLQELTWTDQGVGTAGNEKTDPTNVMSLVGTAP
jgi:hypothetical protein